ncbi:MAG: ABC transporter substrate-binding protein [Treponemataceae bacterium]|nr:MAG: ABC transporter substrate-binding protein [Treponemataceae bacterium]
MKKVFLKSFVCTFLPMMFAFMLLAGCAKKGGSSGTVNVQMWTAPNQGQYNYWDAIITEFNAGGITVDGKTVQVAAQMMPEMPSSEAGIQNALATNSAPAISENINRGFAATLAASGRIYDLQDDSFFKKVAANRSMETILPGWQIGGKQYVIPLYANPMGYHYNSKALRELGFQDVPRTTADVKKLVTQFRALRDTKMKAIGVTHTFLRPQLLHPENWWDRWFDFEMQSNAFSQGKPLVDAGVLTMDETAAKNVLELFGLFGDTLQIAEDFTAFEQDIVPDVFQITAPWDIPKYEAAGKAYGIDGDYVYGPPIVQKESDIPYSFGDAKGLVFYKGGNVSEEQHKGAVAFVEWVYSASRNSKSDFDWFTTTGMLPMRGDISSNEAFVQYIAQRPAYQGLADLMKYAMPSMADEHATEILTALGEAGTAPYITEAIKNKTLTPTDATAYVVKMTAAMKAAGSLR